MKRFFTFLTLYTAASVLSWSLYYQLWHLTRSLDYAITVAMHLLLGPLETIGSYPHSSHITGNLVMWAIETAMLVLAAALGSFRSTKRQRMFWWSVFGLVWFFAGAINALSTA